jgi:predicted RNA polymerase sigma factor
MGHEDDRPKGVEILQAALDRDRLGEYQAQAAIAALHCDAASTVETDWVQIVEWYDELVALTDSPIHRPQPGRGRGRGGRGAGWPRRP